MRHPLYIICCKSIRYQLAAILFPFIVWGQPATISPLSNEYNLFPRTDSVVIKERIENAKLIATLYRDSAFSQLLRAYRESKKINFHSGAAIALNQMGLLLLNNGQYDSALSCFQKAITYIYLSGSLPKQWIPLCNMGNAYFYMGHYPIALDKYYLALKIAEQHHISLGPGDSFIVYKNIALSWYRLGDPKRARENASVLEQIVSHWHNPESLAEFCGIAGGMLDDLNDRKSLYYLDKMLHLKNEKLGVKSKLVLYNCIAQNYINRKKADSAAYYVEETLSLLKQYPASFPYEEQQAQVHLGQIYYLKKMYSDAEKTWVKVVNNARKDGDLDRFSNMAPCLAENYTMLGQYKKAYGYLLQHMQISDSIGIAQKAQSTEIWMQAHLAEKDKIVLEQRLKLSRLKDLSAKKNLWIGGSAIGTLLLLVCLGALIRSSRHKKKLHNTRLAQLQSEKEINQLKALIKGEEQERSRIAVDLRDSIASDLWGIKLNVSTLIEQEESGYIRVGQWETIHQQLDEAARKVRATAHNLMPYLLLDKGLSPALNALCLRMKTQTGVDIEFQEYGPIDRINEDMELSLYRMVQELMLDMLKYASRSAWMLVQLGCTDGLINITIEDNGQRPETGNNPIQSAELINIQKKVATLQGHFELCNQEGIGTTVYIELDLQYLR